MRRDPTDAEHGLWLLLRGKRLNGWKFKRQVPLGGYIVDFVCFEARLIVEADGSQHADNSHDVRRDEWLRAHGFTLLRFWNHDILTNPGGVLSAILDALTSARTAIEAARSLSPLPNPSPTGGEGLYGGNFG
jgi:very-short-patch-repair endonuclease